LRIYFIDDDLFGAANDDDDDDDLFNQPAGLFSSRATKGLFDKDDSGVITLILLHCTACCGSLCM